ncbi:MAG: UDP-N-acetylmuramoylalanyl-D-glutamyl-2,6-diaminopimelate--D-alanyl-D-alanine ligase [Firmicutes bacterium]|nr:UDP-N-acetylmuramoylalanyl-D-glutamyl-2,6-diaminopimelate--D-alanyl-D-alanine ligase [Bacillota bacterium]
MEPMSVRELLEATEGKLIGPLSAQDAVVTSVDTDSRSVRAGGLFVPLVGEHFDGHDFIEKALLGGAAGCLTVREPERYLPGKLYIQVKDTQWALGNLARYYRKKFPIPYIAITGSVGKTTTKEMVAAVLGEKYKVLKTEGNFNNEIGLPLTLFRLDSSHEICVLEMGMNHFGEIEYLSEIVEPDVAIITNIGDAHIENLGSYENILKAKCEVFEFMDKSSLAVLNGDDLMLQSLKGRLEQETIYYGTERSLPYQALDVETRGEQGVHGVIRTPKETFPVEIPALGRHMVYPVLAATVVAERYGITGQQIAAGVRRYVPTKMRMNVINLGGLTILDDAYNANPQSMRAALEVLAQSEGSYKVAILGDMFELGVLGPTLHHGIGECAGKLGIDCLVAVGELSRDIYKAAEGSNIPDVFHFPTKEEAKTILPNLIRQGAVILVKASRGMEFEDLVREIRRVCPQS